jgi:hypothetical protein
MSDFLFPEGVNAIHTVKAQSEVDMSRRNTILVLIKASSPQALKPSLYFDQG